MSKPHTITTYIIKCPKCGRPGELAEYKARYFPGYLETVVNHEIHQQRQRVRKSNRGNDFCKLGVMRKAKDGELKTSTRANPFEPPDINWVLREWNRLNRK